MATELVGRDTMLFMNYHATFKKCRRLMSSLISARSSATYWPVQEAESLKFALNIGRAAGGVACALSEEDISVGSPRIDVELMRRRGKSVGA